MDDLLFGLLVGLMIGQWIAAWGFVRLIMMIVNQINKDSASRIFDGNES